MRKEILVEVSQSDIDTGIARDCKDCPIARAVRRKLHISKEKVLVGAYDVEIYHRDKNIVNQYFNLPVKALEFRRAVDSGFPVKPITFKLKG